MGREATWAAEVALLDATARAEEAEEECAALRAAVARLEAERDELRQGVDDLARALVAATAERDAARAALVEETARRLWAEAYLDALAAYGNVGTGDRWEDMAREHDLWRDRARAESERRGRD